MSYDVVVLGAGAGGMTAAAVAAAEGLRVLLVERTSRVGGTTAISGGMVWVPANAKMADAGLSDTREAARAYLEATVGSFGSPAQQAFLARADEAVAYLEAKTSVRLRPVVNYPDYDPELPGATAGGRVLEPVPFDGRALGENFRLLAPPLPEFTLFGGMMLDRADIPHFRKALRAPRSFARAAALMARHAVQRLSHPRGTSLYLGNALVARLLDSVLRLRVELVLDAEVTNIRMQDGRVAGVTLSQAGAPPREIAARALVVATGGFAQDPQLRQRYFPAGVAGPTSATAPASRGEGIRLAAAIGGRLREGLVGNGFWSPVSRFRRRDGAEAVFPHTVTDRAKPGAIAVDRGGRRFANEAVSYHAFVRAMLTAGFGPDNPAFLIADRAFVWKYGLGIVKPFCLALAPYKHSGYLAEAPTIAALAQTLGIDGEALAATVARYNTGAGAGRDDDFGRGGTIYQRFLGDAEQRPNPCVAPITRAPFYGIALLPGDLGTAAGLATDAHACVLDAAGAPVGGLYACGNDMASVMEGAYPGPGITLGPALTFGYLAARHIAERGG